MWPDNEAEEVERPALSPRQAETNAIEHVPQSHAPTPVSSSNHYIPDADNDTSDSSDGEYITDARALTTYRQVDLLMLKSLESYVLTVRTSDLPCDTRTLRPPMAQVLWPRGRSRLRPRPVETVETYVESSSSYQATSRLRHPVKSTVTLKSTTSLSEGSPPPESTQPRRRLPTVPSMPRASLLARQVAHRIIKYAHCARNIHEEDMCCLSCGYFPICPVTSNCGHTRCTKCIESMNRCPCGNESPPPLFINILIRDLIAKKTESPDPRTRNPVSAVPKAALPDNILLNGANRSGYGPVQRKSRTRPNVGYYSRPHQKPVPMSARARFAYALELLNNGNHKDAVPYLALAAASSHSDLRMAKSLLAQVITVLSGNRDPRSLTRELYQLIRHLTTLLDMSWIKTGDMECILCCEIFTNPVTTPCGHMFCRTCLEKTLDYGKRCPLCLGSLRDFKLTEINDTVFVKGALASINALNIPKPMEDDLVPIFVCTVAYPSIPCPLIIFDPRYWLMIRRVLESGSRRFGMVAMDRDKKYADYGTVLEIRDCVCLEDGRSILSTVGLSRFKVIERIVRDGCELARMEPIHDIPPCDELDANDLLMYASQIMLKAILWLGQLEASVLSDIENAFGCLRDQYETELWWETRDGPTWLWWLVAVLPLRTEIKVLILSTDCLIKRMMAVARTLDAVEHVALATMPPDQFQVQISMPNNSR